MRDALHHQQQALLRNSHSVANTLWQWWTIGWAWRSKAKNSVMRSLALITVAIIQIALFLCAGIFSSKLVLTDHAALSSSKNCGSWPLQYVYRDNRNETPSALREQNMYSVNARRQMTDALNYVEECYYPDSDCTEYIKASLNVNDGYTVDWNASCPFDEALCITQAVHIDTGMSEARASSFDSCRLSGAKLLTSKIFMMTFSLPCGYFDMQPD